jgi:EAL and modified HD-GYP domain-containing signal transduction protein
LLELANIVKLDVLGVAPDALRAQVRTLSFYPVKLLAERVETAEVFQLCRSLGFEYFQGYFFARPNVVSAKEVDHSGPAHMRLLSMLNDPNAEFAQIERVIRQDVTLSYKLLRYVNSAAIGLKRPLDSLQMALTMLGQKNIRRWATLVLFCAAGASKPSELVTTALVRARICEMLAPRLKARPDPATAFTTGLFSLLDALLGVPMDKALHGLTLAPEVSAALTAEAGPLGELVALAVACERGDWMELGRRQGLLGLGPDAIPTAWRDAIRFAAEIKRSV